jgi:voltage-gated potassium channel
MAKFALYKGSSQLFMQLLSKKYGANVWEITRRPEWTTYNEAFESLKQMGANLIADRQDFSIIQRLEEEIPKDAKLYVICDDKVYEQIEQL